MPQKLFKSVCNSYFCFIGLSVFGFPVCKFNLTFNLATSHIHSNDNQTKAYSKGSRLGRDQFEESN